MKLLYGVPKNGYTEVRRYRVIKETRHCYILDTINRDKIQKSKMQTQFEYFALSEESAQNALLSIRMRKNLPLLIGVQVKPGKRIDYD